MENNTWGKLVNRVASKDLQTESRNVLTFWPYNTLHSLNAFRFWQSYLNFTTRLFAYPYQFMHSYSTINSGSSV